MWFVYVLSSLVRNYLYVGLTNNVERRFSEHQAGKERTTKAYRPFALVLVEQYPTREAARRREKFLKTSAGKRWIRKRLHESQQLT